jgi:hypothetical protein
LIKRCASRTGRCDLHLVEGDENFRWPAAPTGTAIGARLVFGIFLQLGACHQKLDAEQRLLTQYLIRPAAGRVQAIRQFALMISGIELAEKIKKGQFKNWQARRVQCDDDGPVERGTRSLSPRFAISKHGGP